MLIGHSMPLIQSIAYAATQAGGGFLGESSDGLVDGIPARVARLQWMSVAGATTDYMRLSFLLGGPNNVPLRAACVLGLSLPVGTLLELQLINGHVGLAISSQIASRAVRFADGTIGAWFVFPAGSPSVNRFDLLVFNDVSGVASIAANTVFEIGEIAAMPVLDIEIERDWGDERIDPTESELSRDSQPLSIGRQAYRRCEVVLLADSVSAVRGSGLPGGMDWSKLRAAFSADARTMAIPRWRTPAGAVDPLELHATAIYGLARMGRVSHLGGDYYGAPVSFQEVPAIL